MNVREALEKVSPIRSCITNHPHWDNGCHQCTASLAQHELNDSHAPIIEEGFRAAWERGYEDCLGHQAGKVGHTPPGNGVTAGVAAMVEGS